MPEKKPKPNFFDRVFAVARKIPKGRVTSYGAIADFCGTGMSSRMVGWAMNASGSAKPPVPAHRMVNRNGLLTGKHHFATPTLMQELLENENIVVENDKIKDFKKLFWDPAKNLKSKKSSRLSGGKSQKVSIHNPAFKKIEKVKRKKVFDK